MIGGVLRCDGVRSCTSVDQNELPAAVDKGITNIFWPVPTSTGVIVPIVGRVRQIFQRGIPARARAAGATEGAGGTQPPLAPRPPFLFN